MLCWCYLGWRIFILNDLAVVEILQSARVPISTFAEGVLHFFELRRSPDLEFQGEAAEAACHGDDDVSHERPKINVLVDYHD